MLPRTGVRMIESPMFPGIKIVSRFASRLKHKFKTQNSSLTWRVLDVDKVCNTSGGTFLMCTFKVLFS